MSGKVKVILSMLIFGTLSIFVRQIPMATTQIAFYRGALGSIFLVVTLLLKKERIPFQLIRKNGKFLLLSGFAVGANWILLFEAYRYTTVSNATISYYFQPVILTMLAPLVFKEALTIKKISFVLLGMFGMVFIIGFSGSSAGYDHPIGIGFGLAAALFYAIAIISNKKVTGLNDLHLTAMTLIIATVILLPYVLLTTGLGTSQLAVPSILSLLVLGVVHTGIAYVLVFSGLQKIEGQTFAVLSYIDPLTAVVVSTVILQEPISGLQLFGGALVLAATFMNEFFTGKVPKTEQVE
ncbi:EamA family transporter [Desemzia sp. RIT804]|uniref:DMT family transporter n=1 Tax=Desemzia sp. RIT 804 TaxID=2810209 RepID=UPI001950D1F2|nr:DMT family transporter [Desemzia sp. RIT 804]MBM6615887.1 EamA family transporter [Desemzia sp. RIT 804]